MDWNLSEEQTQVRDLARQILGDLVTNDSLKSHESGSAELTEPVWDALAKANLTGIAIPEAHGGTGMDFLTLTLLAVEVGRTTAPVPVWPCLFLGAQTLLECGSEAQQAAWLPGVAEGRLQLTAALTELASTDPMRPLTTVKRDGDTFVLDGEKSLVPSGSCADAMLVPASTGDGEVGVFVVPHGTDGVSVEDQDTAWRTNHGHVRLDGVRVEADALVGELSREGATLKRLLELSTAGLCALQLGVSERALEMTAEYARDRVQFDRPIGSFQAVHQRAADAYIQIEGLRLATLELAWRIAQGLDVTEHAHVAKFWAAEGGQFNAYACQHLHGGIGIDVDYPLHRYFLWSIQIEHSLGSASTQLADLGARIAAEGLSEF